MIRPSGRFGAVNTRHLIAPLAWIGLAISASAQVYSPVQSAARPYKLNIVDKVEVAGSDEAAKAFQTNVLPAMLKLVNKNLGEYKSISAKLAASISVDPSKLILSRDSTARVYFLGEGAAYLNTLGVSTTGGGPLSKDAALIFPNASSPVGLAGSGKLIRTSNEPLLPGDFVDLGTFKAGTPLDFFLIANGASGGKDFFSTNVSLNVDGLVHAVSLAENGSAYLVIGFEDIKGGGDRDYNDLVFAVEINKTKVGSLGAPEPSLAVGALLGGVAFFGFSRRRRI